MHAPCCLITRSLCMNAIRIANMQSNEIKENYFPWHACTAICPYALKGKAYSELSAISLSSRSSTQNFLPSKPVISVTHCKQIRQPIQRSVCICRRCTSTPKLSAISLSSRSFAQNFLPNDSVTSVTHSKINCDKALNVLHNFAGFAKTKRTGQNSLPRANCW